MDVCGVWINKNAIYNLGYSDLPSEWTEYTINVSGYNGMNTIVFAGGYYDRTGSSASNTQYCDIRLLP